MKTNLYKRFLKKLTKKQKLHRKRILEISHEAKVSHLGSCLSVVDIVAAIYKIKRKNEKLVLSSGHGAVALYSVLESFGYLKNPNLKNLHVHPDRNLLLDIHVSTGSLGQGLPIAVGMSMANRKKRFFCIISDGECAEGSIWESLRIASENKLTNLTIIVNANGYGAYTTVNTKMLTSRIAAFGMKIHSINGHNERQLEKYIRMDNLKTPHVIIANTKVEQFPFLIGQDAHYKIMSDLEFTSALQLLQ